MIMTIGKLGRQENNFYALKAVAHVHTISIHRRTFAYRWRFYYNYNMLYGANYFVTHTLHVALKFAEMFACIKDRKRIYSCSNTFMLTFFFMVKLIPPIHILICNYTIICAKIQNTALLK